jgi:hypothetical protein
MKSYTHVREKVAQGPDYGYSALTEADMDPVVGNSGASISHKW